MYGYLSCSRQSDMMPRFSTICVVRMVSPNFSSEREYCLLHGIVPAYQPLNVAVYGLTTRYQISSVFSAVLPVRSWNCEGVLFVELTLL